MEQEITHYSCGKLHVGQITGTRIPDPLFPHLVPPAIIISLRLGFRRNFLSVLHPNLVSSPIKGILEILNLTPGAFRWIFWHGRIVSDQVQVRFHIQTYFLIQICKNIDISLLLQRTSDKIIQTSLRTAPLLNSRTTPHEQKS